MTIGVGGNTKEAALAALANMAQGAMPIAQAEYRQRIARAQAQMQASGMTAMWVHAGTNMTYFTGTKWSPSERMVGAIIPAAGPIEYLAPYFEQNTLRDYMVVEGIVHCWHEHENPFALFLTVLKQFNVGGSILNIGVSEDTPFFVVDGIQQLDDTLKLVNAKPITAHCRSRKSANELALMQRAKNMTIEVHKAAASILYEGISTVEVADFIELAHQRVGASGSYFCIVLFGEASAFPHGVKDPQILKRGDMVLIDTGCKVADYISDITRSYVFGEPTARQRSVWNAEKAAQAAAFKAAQIGVLCREVDVVARQSLAASGFGPGYDLPGLPHRTGHGIGMDIHEWPYLVGNDITPLAEGMCFSNEPMICVMGEFGVRLEDHFYMTANGPKWFTTPSHSVDDPFGLAA
jgi:Xaa-Pro dipeptidase